MNKRNQYGKKSDKVKKIIMSGIIIMVLAIIGLVAFDIYNMPDNRADREINRLAADFYENYFYDTYVESLNGGDVAEFLSKYKDRPMDPVYLRRLIVFSKENGGNADEIFKNDKYDCDTNSSKVVYQPVEPYGKKDYTYTVELSCKEK